MKQFFIFVSAICFLSINLHALTVQEVQQKMTEHEDSVQSLSFEFTQNMHSELDGQTKKSFGRASLQKPKKLRIDQLQPENQIVVSDGKMVYIYTPRFNQVLKMPWQQWFKTNFAFPGLTGFSETLEKMKNQYDWSLGKQQESLIELVLKSKVSAQETVHLFVHQDDFIPRKTVVKNGTLTLTTELQNLKYNQPLDHKMFRFKKPSGTAEIEIPTIQ